MGRSSAEFTKYLESISTIRVSKKHPSLREGEIYLGSIKGNEPVIVYFSNDVDYLMFK